MALTRFIPLSEAAQKLGLSKRAARALLDSGKISGGIVNGEIVVTEKSVKAKEPKVKEPKGNPLAKETGRQKEDLPEYKKHALLKGRGISASEASRKYNIPNPSFIRWAEAGFIATLGWDKNRRMLDEADVAYCAEVYRKYGGRGKWLFYADGTPYRTGNAAAG